ncbi:molybdopterin oxidoreductase family protein [Haloarcula sp. GH36]|uniref:molybdopterin oxidoreductase family protein n=1 Tax=Haloarcula montana TaxID=3111776 RepID=UPI002D7737DE|nr:molybdopterin-dependent oxidoreductase [Haloarcula sp. GH36]
MSDGGPDRSTVCPRCGVGCRLAPAGADDRATGRSGPANPNGRLCPEGINALEGIDGRLTEPQVREDGTLAPASWAEATGRVVDAVETTVEAHGPDALAFLGAPHSTTEENYLLEKLARTVGTNNVDNRARHCHVSTARALDARLGWPATTNGLDDLTEADVVLVVGANPAARQPVAFNSFVRPAVDDGATLVHVDPAGNRTTRLADLHVAPRPGRDALVLDLLCRRVLAAGDADRAFVADRTREFASFAASARHLDDGAGVDTAGVDPATLDRVAALVGSADRVAAVVGTGLEGDDEDAAAGTAAAPNALLNLLALTGNLGRPGTGVHVFRGPPNEQGAVDAGCVPDRLPGHQPVTDPEARTRVAAEWGVDPPATPGLPAPDLLSAFGETVRAAVVVGENPAIAKRDPAWVRRQLDALDHLVVLELTESETTAHADVVLPAAAGTEKRGTVTNLDRQVQALRPVAEPPGDVRTDFEVISELGRRLSCTSGQFDYDRPSEAFVELTRVAPPYAGLSVDQVVAGGQRWPADADSTLYGERFRTPDGRVPFVRPPSAPASRTDRVAGLRLVVGGRAGGRDDDADSRLRLHPSEADQAGVGDDDPVTVSDGDLTVRTRVSPDPSVRRGTAFLHAVLADPFVRAGTTTVTIEPVDPA